MSKFPKSIPVFGKPCKIELAKNLKNEQGVELDGQFSRKDFAIKIDESLNNKEKIHTLLHELIHAALQRRHHHLKLYDDLEEDIVRCVEDIVVETFNISLKNKK